MNSDAMQEIGVGKRFAFGANWQRFLATVDERRIGAAEASLRAMLCAPDLRGKSFLDIGCGSGLFSLAARRLGARVHSLDFDPQSVACTEELRRRYCPDDPDWRIEQGSVLDRAYMSALGAFDVVYSWGVLHHTGAMWLALENALDCVEPTQGKLFIAIYNDQGWKSHAWWFIKRAYNGLPRALKPAFVTFISAVVNVLVIVKYTVRLKPKSAVGPLFVDDRERGMSAKYDRIDWIGGFPYEFASFEVLARYLEARGFSLIASIRNSSHGCNELAAQAGGVPRRNRVAPGRGGA
ncbi:MAG TPA: class I SAM-dependent methyltransferase [Steroidobacteraceae bacterium]|nr:class I SAM-dependent methyltransferase [Steroidobacteraceae bacterium]